MNLNDYPMNLCVECDPTGKAINDTTHCESCGRRIYESNREY